jgi:hypothetical protein
VKCTKLLRCVLCCIESSAERGVERRNFRSSKSFERLRPPLIASQLADTCNQAVTVVAPANPSEFLRNHPADRLFCGFLQLQEEILYFYKLLVRPGRGRTAPRAKTGFPAFQAGVGKKDSYRADATSGTVLARGTRFRVSLQVGMTIAESDWIYKPIPWSQ